jgi:hypothetical protein
MAIRISNTTVINDSRQLENITNLKTVGGQSILGTGDIQTQQTFVQTPTITTPTNGQTGFWGQISASAFSVNSGSFFGTHSHSNWQLASDSGFTSVVDSSSGSVNLTSWTPQEGFLPLTVFYVRVRYGSDNHWSDWSPTVSFTTPNIFVTTPTLTVQGSPSSVIETPTLTTSAFNVTNGSSTHTDTDWEVRRSSDDLLIWSSYNNSIDKTSINVPSGNLLTNTSYKFRVRHRSSTVGVSSWAEVTATTLSSFGWAVGSSQAGGFYIGDIDLGLGDGITRSVVLAPKATGQAATTLQWKTTNTTTAGTTSLVDGWTNSNNMNNATHPAAQYTRGLSISGFTDWYLPAKDELNLVWTNRSSLPSGETNDAVTYWSSSEISSVSAWRQDFSSGSQSTSGKGNSSRVRAVRRVIQNLTFGSLFQGGYYVGTIDVGATRYGILLAPKATGQAATTLQWKTTNTATAGTTSLVDGWTNSNNMNNATHPAAQYTRGLSISGFTDWYLPAKDELNLVWTNRSSLPSGETNDAVSYWSSSEGSSDTAWGQSFFDGNQTSFFKNVSGRVRAVRRFVI